MRKLFLLPHRPPHFLPSPPPSSLLPFPLPPPPPSPAPSPSPTSINYYPNSTSTVFLFPSIPLAKSVFDIATISFVTILLFISLLAFVFIFYLRLKSRRSVHLQHFSSLWTVRLLLVSLASLWSINEIFRLPFIRGRYLYPLLPYITEDQQANICKLQVVLSLGFFEPGFLITLLFLINVSIKKKNPSLRWAMFFLLILCSPLMFVQMIFVYFSPFAEKLPKYMHGSYILTTDVFGSRTVLCTYPFFSCVIFAGFGVVYVIAFLVSCWRVMAFVINKGIMHRINVLATTVMVTLPLQIFCLSISWWWVPEDVAYGCVVILTFLSVALCTAVGEIILVVRPIIDALATGRDSCHLGSDKGVLQGPIQTQHKGKVPIVYHNEHGP